MFSVSSGLSEGDGVGEGVGPAGSICGLAAGATRLDAVELLRAARTLSNASVSRPSLMSTGPVIVTASTVWPATHE